VFAFERSGIVKRMGYVLYQVNFKMRQANRIWIVFCFRDKKKRQLLMLRKRLPVEQTG